MANKDTGWRPKGAMDAYKGREVWEYELGAHQVNPGEVDGDVTIGEADDAGDESDETE